MEPTKEANIAEQAVKALGITQLAPALYQDLLQPAARETGRNLLVVAKAVSLALAPLKGIVYGYERIRDDLLVTRIFHWCAWDEAKIVAQAWFVLGFVSSFSHEQNGGLFSGLGLALYRQTIYRLGRAAHFRGDASASRVAGSIGQRAIASQRQ